MFNNYLKIVMAKLLKENEELESIFLEVHRVTVLNYID